MKKIFLSVTIFLFAFAIFSPAFADDASSSQAQLNATTEQLIQVLTQLLQVLKQELQTLLANQQNNNVPPYTPPNPVSATSSTPFIYSINSPANDVNTFYSGDRVVVYGSNLIVCSSSTNCEEQIQIGNQIVSLVSSNTISSSEIIFNAPQLSPGLYNFSVKNLAAGVLSNSIQVKVLGNSTSTKTSISPLITSINPNYGFAQSQSTVSGTNLSGASSVEFYNSNGQFVGNLPITYSTANSASFLISSNFAGNLLPGTYELSVVTDNCAGGCSSNRLPFMFNATPPTPVQPSISLASPSGGEVLVSGTTFPIKWNSSNINNVDTKIFLGYQPIDGSVESKVYPIATISNNPGSFVWTVPNDNSGNNRQFNLFIFVQRNSDGYSIASDHTKIPFTITSQVSTSSSAI